MTDAQGYWLETNEAESNRLILQHRYFTAALGGLLPSVIPAAEVQKVLDVGCGPGGWALDLARQYRHIAVTGIDNSESAIAEAQRRARALAHTGKPVIFLQGDATQRLPFPAGAFDVVHMRSASSFIRPTQWPQIVAELVRVLRPGGWINLVDYEQGTTSSDAFNTISMLSMKAIRAAGASLAPATLSIGAASRLYSFLIQAYLSDASYTIHAVDFGIGNNVAARDFVHEMLVGSANIKPFLHRLGLIESDTSYDELVARARVELMQPDAAGYAFLVSAVACKDEEYSTAVRNMG